MPKQFKLPDLGEGVTEGQVMRLMVAEGEQVTEDQPLMEVETDKAAVEIPSPHTGLIAKLHVSEQQVVNVGDVMVTFDVNGDTSPPTASEPALPRQHEAPATSATPARTSVSGSRAAASPAVRKLARAMGVDIDSINGSGPGGRVTRADVEGAATPSAPADTSASTKPAAGADQDNWGSIRREPVTRARMTIAEHLSRSVSTIPHVTDSDDADITELDAFRRGAASDQKITILPFVIRAVVRALQAFPVFNTRYDVDTSEILYPDYFGIAIGVHTERGLIAPVIRDADQLSVPQIAEALAELADKVRRSAFQVNDTRGGTFTISNAGAMGGSRYSTPIINHPQVAILAIGRSRMQPWVVQGEIVPRLIMPLSLSFDHRVIDGADEVAFMKRIIDDLENPEQLTS
jgi:pyruvate dehydrogenase E2 component (dihydrolipoamide acetyltransferase)